MVLSFVLIDTIFCLWDLYSSLGDVLIEQKDFEEELQLAQRTEDRFGAQHFNTLQFR